jgi:hypothetical protein
MPAFPPRIGLMKLPSGASAVSTVKLPETLVGARIAPQESIQGEAMLG